MKLARRVLKMSAIVLLLGSMLLLSLAGADLLVSGLTTDELTRMGLQPD